MPRDAVRGALIPLGPRAEPVSPLANHVLLTDPRPADLGEPQGEGIEPFFIVIKSPKNARLPAKKALKSHKPGLQQEL